MSRPLRLCVLSIDNGRVQRGVESWSIEFCRHMTALGHHCTLIQAGQYVEPPEHFRTVRVRYDYPERTYDGGSGWLNMVARKLHVDLRERDVFNFAVRCLVPLAQVKPDIVVPVSGLWTAAVAQVYRELFNRRARVIITGLAGYDVNFHRSSLLHIHGAVALEPAVLAKIQTRSPQLPTALIPMGVDTLRFRHAAPVQIDLPHPIVIVTAALVAYKRVHLAIRAAARAGMSLLIVGDGPLRQQVLTLGEELLGSRRFLYRPSVPFDQIPGYYKAADVFTLPSGADEAFSIAIVEAMLAGLPVVVNDDPIRRWIAEDRGQFVDLADIDAYAEALTRAATMERLEEPLAVVRRFDWTSIARQWHAFCQHVLLKQDPTPKRGA